MITWPDRLWGVVKVCDISKSFHDQTKQFVEQVETCSSVLIESSDLWWELRMMGESENIPWGTGWPRWEWIELTSQRPELFKLRAESTARGSEHLPLTASSTAATDLNSLITDSSSFEVEEQPMNYCPAVDINPAPEIRRESLWPYLKGIVCNPCLGNMGPTIDRIMVWVLKLSHPKAANHSRWII